MLADGAPMRNLREAVENAHLEVEGIVASPLAAGYACLTAEERDLGVALVEFGAEVTNVAVFAAGMLVGLTAIPMGSADITDAIASAFGIRRFQAERLKCVHGSAIASPTDHRELVAVLGPGDDRSGPIARGADEQNRIPRSELVSVITGELDRLVSDIGRALEAQGFGAKGGTRNRPVVITGGGSEMAGLADYAQAALGRPVRIGRPPQLKGLPEAHAVPGFATLTGLVLYAAEDPVDIRAIGPRHQISRRYGATATAQRLWHAMKEYF
jgi:cell division protein FtsA